MPTYEISNHAGPDAQSRHNLIYWRQGDWAAVGPGAHGRLSLPHGRFATEAHRAPDSWLAAVEGRGSGEALREFQPPADRALEYLLMSMRLTEGMELARYEAMADAPLCGERIGALETLGMIRQDGTRIWATRAGRPVLNAILRELAA